MVLRAPDHQAHTHGCPLRYNSAMKTRLLTFALVALAAFWLLRRSAYIYTPVASTPVAKAREYLGTKLFVSVTPQTAGLEKKHNDGFMPFVVKNEYTEDIMFRGGDIGVELLVIDA